MLKHIYTYQFFFGTILLFASPWNIFCEGKNKIRTDLDHSDEVSTKIVFFSYGSERYRVALKRILKEAEKTRAFDEVIGFGPDDIDPVFYNDHADVLDATRGGGFWLWKPYFLNRMFSNMSKGDVVMYADAGCEFIDSPQIYIDLARRHGFVGFRMTHPHSEYTKGDIFEALNMDMGIYGNEGQIIGTTWLFQKNSLNERFASDWLRFSQDVQLITDSPSKATNHPNFIANRHDQSIFGLLVLKFNLGIVLKDQTYPRDNSPVISASRLVN